MTGFSAEAIKHAMDTLQGVDFGHGPDSYVLATIDADGNVVAVTSDPEEIARFASQHCDPLDPRLEAFKIGARAFEPTLKEKSRESLIKLGYNPEPKWEPEPKVKRNEPFYAALYHRNGRKRRR